MKEKTDLIRIMKTYDTGEVIIMPTSKNFGRSSYLCYNKECLKVALKKKKIQRTLRKDIPVSSLENIESIIN